MDHEAWFRLFHHFNQNSRHTSDYFILKGSHCWYHMDLRLCDDGIILRLSILCLKIPPQKKPTRQSMCKMQRRLPAEAKQQLGCCMQCCTPFLLCSHKRSQAIPQISDDEHHGLVTTEQVQTAHMWIFPKIRVASEWMSFDVFMIH